MPGTKAKKPVARPAKKKGAASKKAATGKLTDAEKVDDYMHKFQLPFKTEMEAVRTIIKNVNKGIGERIKWKAPSYYYKEQDMVTFNGWATEQVHLVFHHPAVVTIKSPLLQGDYPGRRMAYFKDMKEVKANKKELERVVNELVKKIDKK